MHRTHHHGFQRIENTDSCLAGDVILLSQSLLRRRASWRLTNSAHLKYLPFHVHPARSISPSTAILLPSDS
jgi:hypothetical protein